jgi:hypothetical protein
LDAGFKAICTHQSKARRREPAGCRNQTHAAIFAEMIPVTISATNRSWSSISSISRLPQYQWCNTAAFASRSEAIRRLTAIALRGPASSKAKPKGERTEKWDDPQLDAAQFAIDRFLNAKQTVSEQMAEIYQAIRDGSATDEDRKRLKGLREQYIALSKEVEDVMGRLLVGKQLPHQKSV